MRAPPTPRCRSWSRASWQWRPPVHLVAGATARIKRLKIEGDGAKLAAALDTLIGELVP